MLRALILLALLLPGAAAHVTVICDGDIALLDGTAALTLRIAPRDLALALARADAWRTTGELRAQLPAVRAYLLAHLELLEDAGARAPDGFAWLDDLDAALPAQAPLPDRLAFVLTWSGVRAAPRLRSRLFADQAVTSMLDLRVHGASGTTAQTLQSQATLPLEEGDPAVDEAAAATPEPLGHALLRFIALGVRHIVPDGLDHILFIVGLTLIARKPRTLLLQVSAFTLAHSITLAATLAGRLPGQRWIDGHAWLVETLIALSIVVVAIENLAREHPHRWRWLVVFAFGLVHGVGFAGALRAVGWSDGRFACAVIGFNLGVEAGQLLVVGAVVLATAWAWNRRWYRSRVVVPASLVVAAVGATWAAQRAFAGG